MCDGVDIAAEERLSRRVECLAVQGLNSEIYGASAPASITLERSVTSVRIKRIRVAGEKF